MHVKADKQVGVDDVGLFGTGLLWEHLHSNSEMGFACAFWLDDTLEVDMEVQSSCALSIV